MSKKQPYADLRQAIRDLPSRKNLNKQAVEDNIDIIDEALNRGVPLEKIAEVFRAMNYDMATSTFRQQVREARQAGATAHDIAAELTSTPPKKGRKRTGPRKADEAVDQNADCKSQPGAGMPSTEDDLLDLALAPDPELASDED